MSFKIQLSGCPCEIINLSIQVCLNFFQLNFLQAKKPLKDIGPAPSYEGPAACTAYNLDKYFFPSYCMAGQDAEPPKKSYNKLTEKNRNPVEII